MAIGEIYRNLIEDGKVTTTAKLANELDRFEKRLRNLEAEQDCKNITAEFIILSTKIQENAFANGFREGAKLTTECFTAKQ